MSKKEETQQLDFFAEEKESSSSDKEVNQSSSKGDSSKEKSKKDKSSQEKSKSKKKTKQTKTAEAMAKDQRDISVSEFFAKNRHLLGFDNPRKALLVTVKEAVDNALDACEEAGILPDIKVAIKDLEQDDQYRVTICDNGPGIVKKQIPNIFGKLLYGSKFHQLKMSRGQQGIGIAAAGMYGLMTTGRPVQITSKTGVNAKTHYYELQIDTSKNKPEIIHEEEVFYFPHSQGTEVKIDLVGRFQRGRASIFQYLRYTAIANPHARIEYKDPKGKHFVFDRAQEELPKIPKAIKPHPYGVELGVLIKMLKESEYKRLGRFLREEFTRVSSRVSKLIVEKAGLTTRSYCKRIAKEEADALHKAMNDVKIMSPPTDCLEPIGVRNILAGLHKEIQANFYTATTRSPEVYRGMPFQVEVGLAYGGELPKEEPAQVVRFANRVPLLYQQSACLTYKASNDVNWTNYKVSQPKGSLPVGPLLIMVHVGSVWVPFTSESKEAIANYDEIHKEIKLALEQCGRKLKAYLRKRAKARKAIKKRNVFERYIGEIIEALDIMCKVDREKIESSLLELSKEYTQLADAELEKVEEGTTKEDKILDDEESVLIVEDDDDDDDDDGEEDESDREEG